jgi:glycosyltransferase involved in cell wall biosynthesis
MSHACVYPLFGKRSAPRNVTILGDGIDLKEFRLEVSGSRIRKELGIKPEAPVVGFVARLDPWKGLDVFLKAAAMLSRHFPEAHFLISGGAPEGFERYEQRMRRLAATLGLDGRVHFLGWRYALDDIPELMAALTVFSHTATDPEPFGLVLIEAMAMQRPVVAAQAGGPLEIIVDSESGFLTTPGNPEAHAEAVALLLRDPARARTVGQAGRRRVEEQFSLDRFGHNMAKIYNVVSERK